MAATHWDQASFQRYFDDLWSESYFRKKEYIREVSQQAMDLGFDGLIVESHICPEIALSDAAQQVTPAALTEIISSLIIRDPDSENMNYRENIDELRLV